MKELLERYGFIYKGKCQVCDGNADLYEKDGIKIKIKGLKFILTIKGNDIKGTTSILEESIQKYVPQTV